MKIGKPNSRLGSCNFINRHSFSLTNLDLTKFFLLLLSYSTMTIGNMVGEQILSSFETAFNVLLRSLILYFLFSEITMYRSGIISVFFPFSMRSIVSLKLIYIRKKSHKHVGFKDIILTIKEDRSNHP